MNILTEEQARARRLHLPDDGLLTGVAPEAIEELQLNGAFVEYNQQLIAAAGEPLDYLLCIISGRANLSRIDANYMRERLGALGPGQWFGEMSLLLRAPSREELFAAGDVVVWTIAHDTLRDLFFRGPAAMQLLYNIAVMLAQKLALKHEGAAITTTS